jgi:adenine-specific DNA-methyltransferase
MMYPRLFLARQLSREDGVIFVSIDEHEVHDLRLLMSEVFGEENFIGEFVWQSKKGGGGDVSTAVVDHEYVMCFAKDLFGEDALARITVEAEPLDMHDEKGLFRRGRELNKWGSGSSRKDRPTMFFSIPGPNGEDVYPIRNDGSEGRWRWGKKKMLEISERGDVEFVKRSDGTFIVYEKIRSTDPRLKPYRTWMDNVGTTADGSKTLKELFEGQKIYDFPKPVNLLKHLLSIGSPGDDDDFVLDFFAGSCTTAQAVLELNREDGGNRRFVLVQLPEPTGNKQFPTIAEIGKERIRRVVARMKKERDEAEVHELPLQPNKPEDLGFKVFKLATSNYRQWDGAQPDAAIYTRQAEMFADPLVEGWQPENVLYEVALKEGYGLNIEVVSIPTPDVAAVHELPLHRVTDPDKGQSFYLTLAAKIALQDLRPLDLKKDDLFICRDAALDDEAAANLALQCRLKTI